MLFRLRGDGVLRTWPDVALPRPQLRVPGHQDGAPDNRSPGRRGRNPGGFAPMAGVPVPMIQKQVRAQEAIDLRHFGAGHW